MIIAAWVLLLGLLALMFQGLLDDRYNPNRNPAGSVSSGGKREVVLQRNARGHYVASGRINGQPVVFLVDTGATDVALSEQLANRLGLSKQGGTFSQTANGVVAVWQTRLAEVSVGTIGLSDVRAIIMPALADDNQVLLGMSFLKQLEIIQRDGTLTLRQ